MVVGNRVRIFAHTIIWNRLIFSEMNAKVLMMGGGHGVLPGDGAIVFFVYL